VFTEAERNAGRARAQVLIDACEGLSHDVIEQPPHATFLDRLVDAKLREIIEDLQCVIDGECPENPARLAGEPIGQYHCPRCGCMVVAGVEFHPHDDGCYLGLNKEIA
jgi:hypothetical protein